LISDRIISLREKLNFSGKQKEFAEHINISYSTYQTYEQGKVQNVPYKFLSHLVQHFPNININWLITGEGNMFISDSQDIVESEVINYDNEIIKLLQKLSIKRKEYYYHRIKADLIEEEF
jgi:transcriptional regulator with XRE-family HTH domain